MIDWILAGAVAATAIIIIKSIINHNNLKKVMRRKKVEESIIKAVNHCTNEVTLEDISTGTRYVVRGNDISDEVKFGDCIYNIIGD